MLLACTKHELYKNEQGIRLMKALQIKLSLSITRAMCLDGKFRGFDIARQFYVHQSVPIMHSSLLTALLKVGHKLVEQK